MSFFLGKQEHFPEAIRNTQLLEFADNSNCRGNGFLVVSRPTFGCVQESPNVGGPDSLLSGKDQFLR